MTFSARVLSPFPRLTETGRSRILTALAELKKLNRSTRFLDECHKDTGCRLVWSDDHFLAPDCFAKVVDLKGDMRQPLHDVGNVESSSNRIH